MTAGQMVNLGNKRPNQLVQATPGGALGQFMAAWPGAPDLVRSANQRACSNIVTRLPLPYADR
jgi:hypothetical protein